VVARALTENLKANSVFYHVLIDTGRATIACARIIALSASFSRAFVEDLSVQQSDTEFNALLDTTIQRIFEASTVNRQEQGREPQNAAL
jgi:hypothetical protein